MRLVLESHWGVHTRHTATPHQLTHHTTTLRTNTTNIHSSTPYSRPVPSPLLHPSSIIPQYTHSLLIFTAASPPLYSTQHHPHTPGRSSSTFPSIPPVSAPRGEE
ncbi:hypothetical protein E2C01_081534 [Portunus trituberculatus]|uniref:Uncharacterized protein n=1 Tax=Portunus trituberculatus TaxID=210409 RepID=A0A5B7J1E5_PORTR|nr:hypothetical protein [Portunus trituberculatus]